MTGTAALRRAVTGLLSFAAAPLVTHHNQFKHQQAERVRCVLAGQVPPAYRRPP